MDEYDDNETEVVEEIVIQPTPWHNSDTAAAAFFFAAQMAEAAATHFANLASLAMGQAVHEWHEQDREEMAAETIMDIAKLAQIKESDG